MGCPQPSGWAPGGQPDEWLSPTGQQGVSILKWHDLGHGFLCGSHSCQRIHFGLWASCSLPPTHGHKLYVCTDSFLSFFFFLTLFYFTILYWFCHTLTWIHHGYFLLLLKYNCFTMLYLFLLYNEVNQLYVCTHPLPLGSSSHTPHHPTLLGITEHWASFLHYRAAPL